MSDTEQGDTVFFIQTAAHGSRLVLSELRVSREPLTRFSHGDIQHSNTQTQRRDKLRINSERKAFCSKFIALASE